MYDDLPQQMAKQVINLILLQVLSCLGANLSLLRHHCAESSPCLNLHCHTFLWRRWP